MYFKNLLLSKYKNAKVVLFVDMDGVIADYSFSNSLDFKAKRPLNTNIGTLSDISKLKNIELHILSICRLNNQIKEKNDWLDKYAPFFNKKNRTIISKEDNIYKSSRDLKYEFLKEYIANERTKKVLVIDDDNDILKYLQSNIDNIDLYQDSSILD